MPQISSLAVLISLVVLPLILYIFTNPRRAAPPKGTTHPPGPPGHFLVGNLPDLPPRHSWLKFFEWSKQYGPLFRLNFAGSRHYIVSSQKIANDLLRDRGNIYSSRQQLPAAVVLLGHGLRPLFWPYDETFRQGRKLMHRLCGEKAATGWQWFQELESCRLLSDLIKTPEQYEEWFERFAGGVIFRMGFGKAIQGKDDRRLREILQVVHEFGRVARPGTYLVDMFPMLMWLPQWLAPFKMELARKHEFEVGVMRGLMEDVRREIERGESVECWERIYLEHKDEYNLTSDQAAYVIGTLFEAGAHTTSAAMQSWLLCMVLHPEEYQKLQEELDQVVGNDRLPTFADISNLPGVRATIKETLRYRPVTAGGIPHLSTKDDVYENFFIPAGTNIHANQWAIHRDESLYPQSETFLPSRWLDPTFPTYREPLTQYPNIQHYSAFGFGRRICPGMHIAERSLNLLVARIAWACEIGKKGGVEVPEYDYVDFANTQPKRFEFRLRARSQRHWEVVERAVEEARVGDPLEGR